MKIQNPKEAKEAKEALIVKAQKDKDFKVKLINKPKEMMRVFGVGITDKYKVIVSDQTCMDTFYINIPPQKNK